jgi:hypothetical protein
MNSKRFLGLVVDQHVLITVLQYSFHDYCLDLHLGNICLAAKCPSSEIATDREAVNSGKRYLTIMATPDFSMLFRKHFHRYSKLASDESGCLDYTRLPIEEIYTSVSEQVCKDWLESLNLKVNITLQISGNCFYFYDSATREWSDICFRSRQARDREDARGD